MQKPVHEPESRENRHLFVEKKKEPEPEIKKEPLIRWETVTATEPACLL
jgi:hypothetical protein